MIDSNRISDFFSEGNSQLIWAGIVSTLILSFFGTIVGLILGIFLAYGKKMNINSFDPLPLKIIKYIGKYFCSIYSLVFRGTPMMVQALIFKYSFQAMHVNFENIRFGNANLILNGWLIAGLIVITINTAAYMCEIVISGLNGVDKGQIEGGKSLGMNNFQISFFIILPQALRNSLPTIGNELIVNIKDSSVLNVIAVSELYYRMYHIATANYAFLEGYLILALIYLVMTLLVSLLLKLIEKKLDGVKFSLNPLGRYFRRKTNA